MQPAVAADSPTTSHTETQAESTTAFYFQLMLDTKCQPRLPGNDNR